MPDCGMTLSTPEIHQWKAEVLDHLGQGFGVTDREFDAVYPSHVQRLSAVHWTPVRVACAAVRLLDCGPGARVLDVGSGPGKVCMIGSMLGTSCYFGIEQRPWLVTLARELAATCGLERARFIQGNALNLDWGAFRAFYLYNPFYEAILPDADQIDQNGQRGPARLEASVQAAWHRLDQTAVGARVVTFHGYGAQLPPSFQLERVVDVGSTAPLELWIRQPAPRRQRIVPAEVNHGLLPAGWTQDA